MRKIRFPRLLCVLAALPCGALALAGCNATQTPVAAAPSIQPKPKPTLKPTAKPTPLAAHKPAAPGMALFGVKASRKVFALTFDDGPDPTYTPKILRILKEKGVPATFFMVGEMVHWHASTAKMVAAAGYPIGNHSWDHPSKPKNPVGQIDRTDKALHSVLGITPTLFRPPYGITKNGMAKEASRRGQDVILWSSTGNDWNKRYSAAQIASNVLRNAAPGGIALMHDGGGDRSKTVAMLPGLIDTLKKRGYTLVTVPQLLAMGQPVEASISGSHIARLQNKKQVAKVKKSGVKAVTKLAPPTAKTTIAAKTAIVSAAKAE